MYDEDALACGCLEWLQMNSAMANASLKSVLGREFTGGKMWLEWTQGVVWMMSKQGKV